MQNMEQLQQQIAMRQEHQTQQQAVLAAQNAELNLRAENGTRYELKPKDIIEICNNIKSF